MTAGRVIAKSFPETLDPVSLPRVVPARAIMSSVDLGHVIGTRVGVTLDSVMPAHVIVLVGHVSLGRVIVMPARENLLPVSLLRLLPRLLVGLPCPRARRSRLPRVHHRDSPVRLDASRLLAEDSARRARRHKPGSPHRRGHRPDHAVALGPPRLDRTTDAEWSVCSF